MSRTTRKNSTRTRQKATINSSFDKNLAAYMLAAGAAGVSLLAAQTAEAKIVYTPANIAIGSRSAVPLDLTNDGVADFVISNWQYDQINHLSIIHRQPSNGVISEVQAPGPAADLPLGVKIGPNRFFEGVGSMATFGSQSGIIFFSDGPWKDAHNRYLGLKFAIGGETHYGWARMTVTRSAVTLTGYAYETVANKPIMAGEMSGPVAASTVDPQEMLAPANQPASLGMLARGASHLEMWRRDEDEPIRRSSLRLRFVASALPQPSRSQVN
jgi:hypothetical protein